MKTILVGISALSLFMFAGCADSEALRQDHMQRVREENAADSAREQAKEDVYASMRAVLQPGVSLESFKAKWGEPDESSHREGQTILWYQNEEKPLFISFKDDKLEGWAYDRETAKEQQARRDKEAAALKEKAPVAKQPFWQRAVSTLRYLPSKNTSTRCTSTAIGGTVTTNCD